MNEEQLRILVSEQFGTPIEEVTLQTPLTVDSLSLTEIIVQVERIVGFQISDAEASKIVTVGDLLVVVQQKEKDRG